MNKLRKKFNFLFTTDKIKIYIYTSSQVLSFLLAFLINLFFTKFADPEGYGQYKYATNFLLTVPTFFAFGIPFCCSRLIAKDNADEKHKSLTVGLYITIVLSVIVSIGLSIAFLFGKLSELSEIKLILPFSIVILAVKNLFTYVYQGTGKSNRGAAFTITQSLIVLAGIFVGKAIFGELPFYYCIVIFVLSNLVIIIPILLRMKYRADKESFIILKDEIKSNGIKIYFSSIITTSASSLIALICGSQYGLEEYGYYSLAISFARAFTLISSSMIIVKFKENVNQKFIKKSDILFMCALNAGIYGAFLMFGKQLFFLFFSHEYELTYKFLIVLGLAYLLDGMTLYFNRFFIARGRGDIIVRNSTITAVINIAISVILIPKFKIQGLVFATVISATYNFIQYVVSYLIYYKKVVNDKTEVV